MEPLLDQVAEPEGGRLWINLVKRPLSDDDWTKASFRQRIAAWHKTHTATNGTLPTPTVVVVYSLIGALWWALFRYLVMKADPEAGVFQCGEGCLPFFGDDNMKRFLIYNVLHGILGLGATSGLLGLRFKIALGGVALTFLTPGSLCAPLLPRVAGLFLRPFGGVPGRRSVLAVLCYVAYVVALVRALCAREISKEVLYPIYITLGIATIFDFSIFQAGRGEHYVYMMLCLAFPDWKHGMQVVHLGLLLWAGLAKIGPWFPPVFPFLTKDSCFTWFLPEGCMAKLMLRDYPKDTNPGTFSNTLAVLGSSLEFIFPIMCMCSFNRMLNLAGVFGMTAYHMFIINTLPFASVFEWNYFCIVMIWYLFGPGINSFTLPTSPGLLTFLAIVSGVIPLVGQLQPNLVPFLVGYRPYMGNWRFSWYVVHKKAMHKHRKIQTWEDPFIENNAAWFYSKLGKLGEQGLKTAEVFHYYFTGAIIQVPAYRPIVSVMEHLLEDNEWQVDDIAFAFMEGYQNQVFGWSLGTGELGSRECTREAFVDTCGFEEKEMYFIQFDAAKPLDCEHKVQYRCFDVTKGPEEAQYHGAIPYADLLKGEAPQFRVESQYMQSGKSINGTFLSTYY